MLAAMRAAAPRSGWPGLAGRAAAAGPLGAGPAGAGAVARAARGGGRGRGGARCRCGEWAAAPGGRRPGRGASLAAAAAGRQAGGVGLVVGEEVPPAGGHRGGIAQVALVHLVDQPGVLAEGLLGGALVSHGLDARSRSAAGDRALAALMAWAPPRGILAGLMRLATWNVNSLGARLPRVEAWLAEMEPDVICLQETKLADTAFPDLAFRALGYEAAHHGFNQWNGVAILSRVGLDDVVNGFPDDDAPDIDARMIWATCGGVRVASVYVPNGRDLAGRALPVQAGLAGPAAGRARLGRARGRPGASRWPSAATGTSPPPTTTCGTSPRSRSPPTSPSRSGPPSRTVQEWGLVDLLRARYPNPGLYTYWDYRAGCFHKKMGMRIDHILATAAAGRALRVRLRRPQRPQGLQALRPHRAPGDVRTTDRRGLTTSVSVARGRRTWVALGLVLLASMVAAVLRAASPTRCCSSAIDAEVLGFPDQGRQACGTVSLAAYLVGTAVVSWASTRVRSDIDRQGRPEPCRSSGSWSCGADVRASRFSPPAWPWPRLGSAGVWVPAPGIAATLAGPEAGHGVPADLDRRAACGLGDRPGRPNPRRGGTRRPPGGGRDRARGANVHGAGGGIRLRRG